MIAHAALHDRVVDWLAPVAPHNLVGADARFEPEHEALRAEIEKLHSVRGESPDWARVERDGLTLLTTRSKDLLIAAYVCAALSEREGYPGLLDGLRLVQGLLGALGQAVYPLRTRARANALSWLLEHVASALSVREPAREQWTALREVLSELRACSELLLGDEAPSFSSALRALERVAPAAPESVVVEPTEPASPVGSSKPETSALAPPSPARAPSPPPVSKAPAHSAADVSVPSELGALPSEAAKVTPYLFRVGAQLIELGRQRFEVDRSDPRGYRLLRVGLWLPWDRLPPANARGRTELHPIAHEQTRPIHDALREGHWESALAASEALLRKSPFWLEGHLLSANALEQLGEPFAAAKALVEAEARAFAQRHPRLCALQFADGTPLCPPAVATWLALEATPKTAELGPALARPSSVALEPALRSALAQGEPAALTRVRELLLACKGARERFQLTLELAHVQEETGRREQAGALYLGLERDVEAHQLWSWEPELAVTVWRAVLRHFDSQTPSKVKDMSTGDVLRIRGRLAQLSATALL